MQPEDAVVLPGGEFFFFQAEDGIRDLIVTGVQTCALPIFWPSGDPRRPKRVRMAAERLGRRLHPREHPAHENAGLVVEAFLPQGFSKADPLSPPGAADPVQRRPNYRAVLRPLPELDD